MVTWIRNAKLWKSQKRKCEPKGCKIFLLGLLLLPLPVMIIDADGDGGDDVIDNDGGSDDDGDGNNNDNDDNCDSHGTRANIREVKVFTCHDFKRFFFS